LKGRKGKGDQDHFVCLIRAAVFLCGPSLKLIFCDMTVHCL